MNIDKVEDIAEELEAAVESKQGLTLAQVEILSSRLNNALGEDDEDDEDNEGEDEDDEDDYEDEIPSQRTLDLVARTLRVPVSRVLEDLDLALEDLCKQAERGRK